MERPCTSSHFESINHALFLGYVLFAAILGGGSSPKILYASVCELDF